MQRSHSRGRVVLWLLVMGVGMCLPMTSWAQAKPPAQSEQPASWSGSGVVAGVGAVVGSIVYAPFKALILCPVSAVASGAAYAVEGGETDTPKFLLRLGCTGTYVIAPAMVQGQEAFRAYTAR